MHAYKGNIRLTGFGIAKALKLTHNEEGKIIPQKNKFISSEYANYTVTDTQGGLFFSDPSSVKFSLK